MKFLNERGGRLLSRGDRIFYKAMICLGLFKGIFAGIAIGVLLTYVLDMYWDISLIDQYTDHIIIISLICTILYFIVGVLQDNKIERWVDDKDIN